MSSDMAPPGFSKALLSFMLGTCIPIYWHDRSLPFPKKVEGASGFVLRFDGALVGVTAAHVIRCYEQAAGSVSSLVCQLRTLPFDISGAIIDLDDEQDIATFSLSEAELAGIGANEIDCRGEWPPPPLEQMRALTLVGFPESERILEGNGCIQLNAFGALAAIEDFTDRKILVTYDPIRDRQLNNIPMPQLGANLSGCSGGPVLMHGTRNGLHRWFPVGLIAGGTKSGTIERGAAEGFDQLFVQRIHRLLPTGAIERTNGGGWSTGSR